MRRTITWLMIIGGLLLMVISYFFLTAPWGADRVANSNPRLSFAPLLLIAGIVIAFSAAIVYELLPDRSED